MKLFMFPATLLTIVFLTWNTLVPSSVTSVVAAVDTIAVRPPLPEPLLDQIILEDSVSIWEESTADIRPVRPYRPGEELLPPFEPDTTKRSRNKQPQRISWKLLTDIRYVLTYNKRADMEMHAPIFPDTLKNLAGKLVSIRGYVIPFDESQEAVALSANPYASCFFCGKASPASVLTLRFSKPGKRYKVDARRGFKGRLRLNYDDPEEFYYVLEEAEEL